jgi:hypothetical protein
MAQMTISLVTVSLVTVVVGLTCPPPSAATGAVPVPVRALGGRPGLREAPSDRSQRATDVVRVGAGVATRTRRPGSGGQAAISKGPDSLQLLSQTAWVGPGQSEVRLHLGVTASDEAYETLSVSVYRELTARSQFQAAFRGDLSGSGFYYWPPKGPAPLNQLPRDPTGGVDVDIGVNNGSGGLPLSTTGVYPVEVFLEKDGARLGAPLTVFVVYAGSDARNLQRLNADLVVPVAARVPISSSGLPGAVPPASASALRADSAELARWQVPVTVEVDVPTVQALAKGGPADARALAHLEAAVASGDELLPATSLPLDLGALVSSGLTSDIRDELTAGASALGSMLGASPTTTTWAFSRGVDASTMSAIVALGAQQVAVPEGDLSALPVTDQKLTFAQPTRLSVRGGHVDVIGADSELSSRIAESSAPERAVLVANQVLAELAMIDLEAPSDTRGVVLLPSPGITVNATFLGVFLAGLQGNPLIKAVTLAELFHNVPLASGTTTAPLVRQLEGPRTSPPLGGTGRLQEALSAVRAAAQVYGATTALVGVLGHELVVSLSAVFSVPQRAAIIGAALQSAQVALAKVRLPPSNSITLTSRQGSLPLTLLSSAGTLAHVRLVLSSEELSFMAKRFDQGRCAPIGPGSEQCELTLSQATTALQVPVVVRTIGAFPLSLEIETPDGSEEIAAGTYTVRSTAISDLGLVLMVGAALFLAIWWARNARHGRRAKRLVPRPTEEDAAYAGLPEDVPEGARGNAPGTVPGRGPQWASGGRGRAGHSLGPTGRPSG